jgi:hypothetical protein
MRNPDNDNLADHIVAALAPCQYEGLLSRAAAAGICRFEGGSLPAGITSLFGFECRLGEEEPAADFLVRVGAAPEEWSLLELHAAGCAAETWRRIAAVLSERARPSSPFSAMLQNLWLEYDLAGSMNTASPPSVFFGTNRLVTKAETEWASELVARLRGEPLSAASRQTVHELVAVLPEAAKVFQVGVMCSRPRSPLRVCVIGQGLSEVCTFLAAVRWPGEWPPVAEVLRQFIPVIDYVALDLDIFDDGRLAPRLGVELYQRTNPDLSHRMVELINKLTDANLSIPQKSVGLLAWCGITHERCYGDLWPAGLLSLKALRGGSESSTFCRWLHHVKIVLDPNAPPAAKAYLAVSHAFLADSVIREALERAALAGPKPG